MIFQLLYRFFQLITMRSGGVITIALTISIVHAWSALFVTLNSSLCCSTFRPHSEHRNFAQFLQELNCLISMKFLHSKHGLTLASSPCSVLDASHRACKLEMLHFLLHSFFLKKMTIFFVHHFLKYKNILLL